MQSSNEQPLLSIAIPTRNASARLPIFFDGLSLALRDVPYAIELVVGDNHSEDSTARDFSDFLASCTRPVSYQFLRHESNLGFSGNLHSLLQCATGKFFTFLGDDDKLHPNEFRIVLDFLAFAQPTTYLMAPLSVPGAICAKRDGYSSHEFPSVSIDNAPHFLYDAGNAYAGIAPTTALQAAASGAFMLSPKELESHSWAQLLWFFGSMASEPSAQAHVMPFRLGSSIQGWGATHAPDAAYWLWSFSGLLDATLKLDAQLERASGKWISPFFFSMRSPALANHVLGLSSDGRALKGDTGRRLLGEMRAGVGRRGTCTTLILQILLRVPRKLHSWLRPVPYLFGILYRARLRKIIHAPVSAPV